MTQASPTLPPATRSPVASDLAAAAARGRFELQRCGQCAAVQYPPREACFRCLSPNLEWTPQSGAGKLIAATTLHHSYHPYFQQRLPWRVGLVWLDVGPTVVAHVHCLVPPAPASVEVVLRLDGSGQAMLIARSPGENVLLNDDPRIKELCGGPNE